MSLLSKICFVSLFLVLSATEALGQSEVIKAAQNRCLITLITTASQNNDWMDARMAVTRCACLVNARAQNLSIDACPGWDVAGQWVREYMKD